MSFEVIQGDCVELMQGMEPGSVDAVVCDPPYGLEFMGKGWDRLDLRQPFRGEVQTPDNPYGRTPVRYPYGNAAEAARAQQEWHQAWATEALRVLKPGGHLLAFGGTRTYHRLVCAVEDAGFEIRDTISWLYGSGFPKSLDVGKQIDKAAPRASMFAPFAEHYAKQRKAKGLTHAAVCGLIGAHGEVNHGGASVNWEAGHNVPTRAQWTGLAALLGLSEEWTPLIERVEAEREKVGEREGHEWAREYVGGDWPDKTLDITAPATPEAQQWEGWGTALKPAHEPVVVARKPLSGTVAGNVLEHGTGALNIDSCRIDGVVPSVPQPDFGSVNARATRLDANRRNGEMSEASGRWPANVVLSHTEDCEQVGTRKVRNPSGSINDAGPRENAVYGEDKKPRGDWTAYGDADGTETVAAWKCSPDCPVRLLDEQTGELAGPGSAATNARLEPGEGWGGIGRQQGPLYVGEQGGASRFFYVAKASRAERNAGLEGFEEQPAGGHVRSQDEGTYWEFVHPVPEGIGEWLREAREAAGLSRKDVAQHFPSRTGGLTGCVTNWEEEFNRPTPNQWQKLREVLRFDDRYDTVMTEQREVERELFDDKPRQTARNVHPTVKPIELMRWLVRLVTPPGGTVLDPFTGSGSTGCAAVLEGFDFVGLEREEEYVRIAEARIAWWHKHRGDGKAAEVLAAGEKRESVEATGQLGIFDE